MATLRTLLLRLPSTESMLPEELRDDWSTQPKALLSEFSSNVSEREIGPANALLHGVARNEIVQDLKKRSIEIWKQLQYLLAATPFFRDRPGGI
jgi:hypothetical protein